MNELNVKTFVVLGEGLAAGVSHFSLSEDVQPFSFPALVANQINPEASNQDSPSYFAQPVMESPGVGNVGFAQQPAIVPELLQTTVVKNIFRDGAILNNLSVPGLSVNGALKRRPSAPLVQSDDANQTLLNLILGIPGLTEANGSLPTQVEYANSRKPDLVLIALGYQEALESLVDGHLHEGHATDLTSFAKDYAKLLKDVSKKGRKVVVCTIPNPLDTAYFSDLKTAAHILRTEVEFLREQYDLKADDLIDLRGLTEIGFEFTARQLSGTAPEGTILSASQAKTITSGIATAASPEQLPQRDPWSSTFMHSSLRSPMTVLKLAIEPSPGTFSTGFTCSTESTPAEADTL